MEVFIISALDKYSDMVLRDQKQLLETMKNHIIQPALWIHLAELVNKQITERTA